MKFSNADLQAAINEMRQAIDYLPAPNRIKHYEALLAEQLRRATSDQSNNETARPDQEGRRE